MTFAKDIDEDECLPSFLEFHEDNNLNTLLINKKSYPEVFSDLNKYLGKITKDDLLEEFVSFLEDLEEHIMKNINQNSNK
ncbi:MAG: hypothetical protein LBT10_07180 [Methanobrevibacter sp.]|nr:hypothetical protein [Methanobrevibacter sp.]